jgi:RsiW-degrading membrane proteinase PrsW (M82 family)
VWGVTWKLFQWSLIIGFAGLFAWASRHGPWDEILIVPFLGAFVGWLLSFFFTGLIVHSCNLFDRLTGRSSKTLPMLNGINRSLINGPETRERSGRKSR